MARQQGILKFKGNIGDFTFYKTRDGFDSRRKGGIDKTRILTDPRFERTRENAAEFKRVIAASKLLKAAFRPLLRKTADSRMWNRLTSEFVRIIKADSTSIRGERNVMNGVCGLLERFEFNSVTSFGTIFTERVIVQVDRAAGMITVEIPSFVPMDSVEAAQGATHFRIISAGAEFDFTTDTHIVSHQYEQEIPVHSITPTATIHITHLLTANTILPLFTVVGIEFVQMVNGMSYPLTNRSFNALTVVKVDQV